MMTDFKFKLIKYCHLQSKWWWWLKSKAIITKLLHCIRKSLFEFSILIQKEGFDQNRLHFQPKNNT